MMVVGRAISGGETVPAKDLGRLGILRGSTSILPGSYLYAHRPTAFPGQGQTRMFDRPDRHCCESLIIGGTKKTAYELFEREPRKNIPT